MNITNCVQNDDGSLDFDFHVDKNEAEFDKGMQIIVPSCFPECSKLVNTMPKCRVCDWKGKDANIQK